jgi:hypothetical protein
MSVPMISATDLASSRPELVVSPCIRVASNQVAARPVDAAAHTMAIGRLRETPLAVWESPDDGGCELEGVLRLPSRSGGGG